MNEIVSPQLLSKINIHCPHYRCDKSKQLFLIPLSTNQASAMSPIRRISKLENTQYSFSFIIYQTIANLALFSLFSCYLFPPFIILSYFISSLPLNFNHFPYYFYQGLIFCFKQKSVFYTLLFLFIYFFFFHHLYNNLCICQCC